jgi:hypothetical protein
MNFLKNYFYKKFAKKLNLVSFCQQIAFIEFGERERICLSKRKSKLPGKEAAGGTALLRAIQARYVFFLQGTHGQGKTKSLSDKIFSGGL